MDGLGEVMGGATDVAPVTQGNENGVAAAEPVQPAQPVEAAAPMVEAAATGIPIERVEEVGVILQSGYMGDDAPLPVLNPVPREHWKRLNRLENSPYFEQVKTDCRNGVKSKQIAQFLHDQKVFPDLTLPGISSMVARALMRAGLMKPDARLSGFGRTTKPSKLVRASSMPGGKLLSLHQVAKRYKVLDSAIRSWAIRGVLDLKDVGTANAGRRGQWLFPLAAIERWERKQETFQAITAVREFILRQRAAEGGKAEVYLSPEQVGSRYGITGSAVQNWLRRGAINKGDILANGGFEGDGKTLFTPESYLIRWEKTPRAQELYSVRITHSVAHSPRSASAVRGLRENVMNLNGLGARYGVTGGAVWLWMKKGSVMKDLQRFFAKGSRSWHIPLSAIEQWESSPEARRAALTIPTLRRYFSKRLVATPISHPRIGASKEVDVAAIARATGLPSHHVRKVLEKAGLSPKALKLSQTAISEIENILTAGSDALVQKDGGSGFIVKVAG